MNQNSNCVSDSWSPGVSDFSLTTPPSLIPATLCDTFPTDGLLFNAGIYTYCGIKSINILESFHCILNDIRENFLPETQMFLRTFMNGYEIGVTGDTTRNTSNGPWDAYHNCKGSCWWSVRCDTHGCRSNGRLKRFPSLKSFFDMSVLTHRQAGRHPVA